jgi:DNA-binding MarR family transcriptional regulator
MSVKLDVIRIRERGRVVGTRSLGADVAEEIRSSDPAAKALVLDFTGVRVASSPFLDEVVCASRAAIVDHPDRHVVYGGLDEDVLDKLELVAERRGIALTVLEADELRILGGRRFLDETLAAAQELGEFAATDLAERLELKLPNLHQRLTQLQAAGAITRADDPTAQRGRRLKFATPDARELTASLG